MTRTRVPESTDNRFASALPAEPPPTMMKSYLRDAMNGDAISVARDLRLRPACHEDRPPFRCQVRTVCPTVRLLPAAEFLAADGEPAAADAREEDDRREARAGQSQMPVELGVAIGDRERDGIGIDPVRRRIGVAVA